MKKIFTLAIVLLATMAAAAQTSGRNLFDKADIDENGWLWFDTAEKIEKYIGVINETDYLVDPNGKPIQMVYADVFPDYPASEASEEFVGAGTDGETGSEGSRTGAIMLQPASGVMSINGGGFVVCMPSCYSYAICYSSNSKVMTRLVATANVNAPMSNCLADCALNSEDGWRVISASYVSVFKRLPAGINVWDGLEKLNNNYEPITTFQSEEPVYVWFQSATADTIYVHGIKAITQETEIVDPETGKDEEVDNEGGNEGDNEGGNEGGNEGDNEGDNEGGNEGDNEGGLKGDQKEEGTGGNEGDKEENEDASITTLDAAASAVQAIYTIDGRMVGNDISALKRGLYIVIEQGKARKVLK